MKPQGIPDNYVQISTGEWCHPSRVTPRPHYVENFGCDAETGPLTKPKRIRQSSKPLMNKLEQEWLSILQQQCGAIIYAQSMRFKLANGIWYKPDFVVFYVQTVTAYECKGPHAFRGGFENLKVAAHQYPNIKWALIWKQDRQWKEQMVLA